MAWSILLLNRMASRFALGEPVASGATVSERTSADNAIERLLVDTSLVRSEPMSAR